jgi:maltooligosyltrehalose trehalohydrolase
MNRIGPNFQKNGKCKFTVWAPNVSNIALHIVYPENKLIPLRKKKNSYWVCKMENIDSNCLYYYRINKTIERPDPASKFQPYGVSGPSQVLVHSDFVWQDENWQGCKFKKLVIYELHVGTFSSIGTYHGVISKLNYLVDLGVNCIELMPVAEFSGSRNWGYDGVFLFAPHNSYGTPSELKELVQACHLNGLSVILDVVYNHLGPEGSGLDIYGPYLSTKNITPWGKAFNFTEKYNKDVRNYFFENAFSWLRDYHFDVLRIDSIDNICKYGATSFLKDLNKKVKELSKHLGNKKFLIAESDMNDPDIITPIKKGGIGFKAQWSNEFHHFNHTILTGERDGYYSQYGKMENLVSFIKEKSVFHSKHKNNQNQEKSFSNCKPQQFIIYLQNHDQIGNRPYGERLSSLVGIEAQKLAAGLMFIMPHIPLLFMGEEYAEDAPFLFFIDYQSEKLLSQIGINREKEFAGFISSAIPNNPSNLLAFTNSRLKWFSVEDKKNFTMFNYYKSLILLKKSHPVLRMHKNSRISVSCKSNSRVILFKRWWKEKQILAIMNFSKSPMQINIPFKKGKWSKILDSSDTYWAGKGSEIPKEIDSGNMKIMMQALSIVIFGKP